MQTYEDLGIIDSCHVFCGRPKYRPFRVSVRRRGCYKSVVQRCEGGNVRSDRRGSAVSALRIFVRRADGGGGARCRLRRWGVHVPVGWWMGSSILPPPYQQLSQSTGQLFIRRVTAQRADAQQQPRRRYSGTSYEALAMGIRME